MDAGHAAHCARHSRAPDDYHVAEVNRATTFLVQLALLALENFPEERKVAALPMVPKYPTPALS